jgi:predicted RecB family nuclease
MGSRTLITGPIFDAFLKCKLKAHLIAASTGCVEDDLSARQQQLEKAFRHAGIERLRKNIPVNEVFEGTPSLKVLQKCPYRLIINPVITAPGIHTQLHALGRLSECRASRHGLLQPIRFVASAKPTNFDKFMLGFDALALFRFLLIKPETAYIVYGQGYNVRKVQVRELIKKATTIVGEVSESLCGGKEPEVVLNKHCLSCQFRVRCQRIAVEKDDLSLLSNLTPSERQKHNARGVFTVNQLSYTYRTRKNSRADRVHEPALKALAIRKQIVHIVGSPKLVIPAIPVYLDVEGVPDIGFYYLIGWRYEYNGAKIHKYAWADTVAEEREVWKSFISDIQALGKITLLHYGRYEITFLERMKTRYCVTSDEVESVENLVANSVNLLSFLWSQVYIPTYTNGLKDVACYLGYRWSNVHASGLHSLMWRSEWEATKSTQAKCDLVTYNMEDCEAAECVAQFLARILSEEDKGQDKHPSVNVSSLPQEFPRQFGPLEHAISDFKLINQAAYWDYQRSRVYIRSNARLRKTLKPRKSKANKQLPITRIIHASRGRDERCARCGGGSIHKHAHHSTLVLDLRFSSTGVRRQVTRYEYLRFRCWDCHHTYNELPRQDRYGPALQSFVVYQLFKLMISQHAVAENLGTLFGCCLSPGAVNVIKSRRALYYAPAYKSILSRLLRGNVIHADETQIKIGKEAKYVWVLTNTEDVYYFYGASREASVIRDVLGEFGGVLVSDFYAAYDTLKCAKQKCLVHLMRDINDDLLKNPFDSELCAFARAFANVLRPIVETIDRYGLKRYHLRKHHKAASTFMDDVAQRGYSSEIMLSYKKRVERNRDALFTFLNFDGVAWNNNNAEHAVKAVARLRNVVSQGWTEKGVAEYLILLSVTETCHFRNIELLDFLRSGSTDLEGFVGGATRRVPSPVA